MASNLIGRLVEATNPVASIAGPELGHAPVGVAHARALATTCSSLSPPFSLPPTWSGFIETLAPRAGSGAQGGAGSWKVSVAGWGGNPLPKACLRLGAPRLAAQKPTGRPRSRG